MENIELLDQQIKRSLEELDTVQPGSESSRSITEDISTLMKLRLESEKVSAEERSSERELEAANLVAETASKDRVVEIIKTITTTVVPICAYGVWLAKSFKFEETGFYRSTTMKELLKNFHLRF